MEELVEGPIKLIARAILRLFRFIVWLIWEMMCERLLWYLGWPVARAFSLGHYPKQSFTEIDNSHHLTHFVVAIIGFAYPVTIVILLTAYLE